MTFSSFSHRIPFGFFGCEQSELYFDLTLKNETVLDMK